MRRLTFILSAISLLTGVLCAAPPENAPAEISGLLQLRFNNCFNPDHVGPHETYLVRDLKTRRGTDLDVGAIDTSRLKPGKMVRVKGKFKDDPDHPGRGKPFQATEVIYEEAAGAEEGGGDGGAAAAGAGGEPIEAAGAPAVTDLTCLMIFANTLDYTNDVSKMNTVSNMLFGTTQNVSEAIFHASYGHFRLLDGDVVVVNLATNAVGAKRGPMTTAMELAAVGEGFDPSTYDRFLVFCPDGVLDDDGTSWTAYGYYGGGRTEWSYGWTATYFDGLVHELGHNFGFRHAGDGGNSYGDRTCAMGYSHSQSAAPRETATYTAPKKKQRGWFDPYPGSHTSITSDATFDLYPISMNPETTPGMRAVQIEGSSDHFISYRREILPYAWLRTNGDEDKVYVHTAVDYGSYFGESDRAGDLIEGASYSDGTTNVIFELYGSNMDYVAVSIDFPDGNTKPVADAQSVTAYLDTPQSITLTGSDDDVADTLTYSVYLSPTNGVISGTGVNITYTPTNGYTGPDSFVFKVNDGKICSFATVSITVDLPAASVVASDDAAAETGPDGGAWTISRTGETGTSMTVFFALGGTATLTNDYTVDATSPITLPAGQTNITVNLTTVDDSVFDEGNETAILTILPDAAYSIGSASGTITIADNDFAAPMVSNYSVVADAETSATISGWVTSGGVVQAWICWGLADGGTLATSNWDNVVSMGAVNIGAEFPTNLTGLSTNVTYWYRCYVTNSLGSDWSDTATAFSGVPAGGTGGGGATPVSGAYLEWDASRNSDPNNWTSVTANTYTWTFAVAGQTPAIVTDPRFDLVTKAYSFPDSRDEAGNASLQSIGAGSGQPATFEFVLDIDAVNGIIFESGATGDGIQFDYNNGDLRGYIKESHDTLVSYTLTAEDLGRFIHVVFVADQVNDLHQLYVDGELKSSKAWTGSPWAGGDGAALGGSSGNQANGNVGDFNGHIALFRYYDGKAFTAEEVTTNFNALSSGGVIANLAPTGVTSKAAHINASLGAAGTNYDVYVYWGTVNEGTNAAAWTASAQVGSWTNVATEVSYPLSGLTSEQTYYYAFRASNVVTNVWAQPSWQFMTLVAGAVTTNHSVPHSWLASQNASWTNDYEIAATNDPDSDGFTTAEEYWSGTDPQDGSSYLRIEDVESLSGNVNLIWLHSKADAGLPPIIIQWRASMLTGAWTYAGQNTPSDGTNTWDALMLQGGFYRLAVTNMP